MRLFLGTLLDAANQQCYRSAAARLVLKHAGLVRAVPDGTVHVTYAFMPRVPEELLPPIAEVVDETASAFQITRIVLASPTILWVGRNPRLVEAVIVDGESTVRRLTLSLADGLRKKVPDLDVRPSKAPHVTIARFRKHASKTDALAVTPHLDCGPRSDAIRAMSVIESVLTSRGPVYDVRHEARLAGSATPVPDGQGRGDARAGDSIRRSPTP